MSDRPGGSGRAGGRATSTSQQSPPRPEPGPGKPVRSNGPERTSLPSSGPRAGQPAPGPEGPALRVILVSRDKMLASALRSLIETPGGVRMLDWYSEELDTVIRHADVVIVDMPPTLHERTFAVLDGRFLGRTVVLLQEGEHVQALPPSPPRTVLYRPLQIGELWSAVTGATETRVTDEVAPEQEAALEEAGESTPPELEPDVETSPEPELEPDQDPPPGPELQPDPPPGPEVRPDPEVAATDQPPAGSVEEADGAAAAVEVEGPGLPVSESGRLIGLSGQELDPVIGPGQVAPGMDEATFERLRGWKTGPGARQPAGRKSPASAKRRAEAESQAARQVRAAEAEARRELARQKKTARAESRKAARAEAGRQRMARADARTAAREEQLQAQAAQAEARRIAREERQARAEEARQAKAARKQERQAARAESRQARAARAEERRTARAESRRVQAAETEARRAARDQERQARAAEAEARRAARAEARQAEAAEAEARRAVRDEARRVEAAAAEARKAEQAEARRVAREESRQAKIARAAERRAAHEEAVRARAARKDASRQARSARAEERRAARAQAREKRAAGSKVRREQALQATAARAEVREAARAEARQRRTARAEARKAARAESRRARAARAEERRTDRAAAAQARSAQAEARQAARAEEKAKRAAEAEVRRQQAQQAKAAKAEAQAAARAEASQAKAARAEERRTARAAAAQAKAAQEEAKAAARREAEQARAAEAEARKAEQAEAAKAKAIEAEARRIARAEAGQVRAAKAEERRAARAAAAQARAEARKSAQMEAERVKAAQAEARTAERAAAAQAKAVENRVKREQSRQDKAAKAEARELARAEAARERAARRTARDEARRAKVAADAAAGATPTADAGGRVARPAVVALLMAVLAVGAAGWVGAGGADTRAGEVAVVRAAGGSGGGLVVQDPRVGPIEPVYALGAGIWLRATEAGGSLEAVVREARVPSRFLLAGVVGLTVALFLLLMRVGPGSGAAAGPGPAPPQGGRPGRLWRLGGAALAGALVALDPLVVQSGRAATGTVLAVLLAVGTVALAWGVPARPVLRWLPLVAAGGGLALLVSPLALPVLAVPVVAELLHGRYQEAWKDMAALGLAIGLWLLLPVWVAGQDLGAGQAGWLLGRPQGRGSVAASLAGAPLTWLLVAAGLAAAILTWRHRSGARSDAGPGAARLLAWSATSAAGALAAIALGYPAEQALPFAVPAAAVSVAVAAVTLVAAGATQQARRAALAGAGVVLVGLLAAQAVNWAGRYGGQADDGLGRLVATVGAEVPECSAVNASGPDDRARLLAAGVTVTEFSSGPAAHAAGVRYFVLTGGTAQGPLTPSLAAWVRQHGTRLAAHPSRSLSGVELWRVDAAPLDPVADLLPLPDGVFSNTTGSACGGYRVVDSQAGTFHSAYRSVGGKAVLGRPLGSVWTSDGPALQAFDTMVLGAVPTAGGPPAVRPIELPPLLAKLDVEAVADADIPLPSTAPPVTNRQTRALLREELIARAYLGTDPATATAEDFARARDRFGRPLGLPQIMPDGAMRQPFERAVLELPADGGPVRPAALGQLAVRLGLVPRQAMRPEPVPGLPAGPAEIRLDPAPLLRLVGGALALLLLAAGAGAVVAWRQRTARDG